MYFRKEDIPAKAFDHLCARNKFRFNSTSVYSAINKLKAELNFRKREISLPSGCRDKRLMAVLIPFWRENQIKTNRINELRESTNLQFALGFFF